jgi:AbrB family looped-hinge helix DNA binding protein
MITIDSAGRLVIPKSLRDELGLTPETPLRASVRDGHLELAPEPLDAQLIDRDGVLVIVPSDEVAPLTRDDVRAILDSVRR